MSDDPEDVEKSEILTAHDWSQNPGGDSNPQIGYIPTCHRCGCSADDIGAPDTCEEYIAKRRKEIDASVAAFMGRRKSDVAKEVADEAQLGFICTNHTDAERVTIKCPVCLARELEQAKIRWEAEFCAKQEDLDQARQRLEKQDILLADRREWQQVAQKNCEENELLRRRVAELEADKAKREAKQQRLRELDLFFRTCPGPCDPQSLGELDAERIRLRQELTNS